MNSRHLKSRLCAYLSPDTGIRLDAAARRPGTSKSRIVDDAVAAHLSGDLDDRRDGALIRRIDQIARQIDRLERDLAITGETLALFIRFFLTVTPPLPESDQNAARAKGRERYEGFVETLERRLAKDATLTNEISEEIKDRAANQRLLQPQSTYMSSCGECLVQRSGVQTSRHAPAGGG